MEILVTQLKSHDKKFVCSYAFTQIHRSYLLINIFVFLKKYYT